MNKNDDLQFMPMMRGKIQYTNDEFKKTNIKNHGVKKGTVKWYHRKFVNALVLGGTTLVLTAGAIHAFDLMKGAPKSTTVSIGDDLVKGGDIMVEEPNINTDEDKYVTYSESTSPYNRESDEIVVTPVEQTERCVVDYKVKAGDTLDGIIYKYTDSASEKDYYKNYVTFYNNIDDDIIRMGDVITLVGVPVDDKDDLNTGYNENFNKDDEMSTQLNGAVQELLDEYGRDYAKGSLIDTIVKELEVFNSTTNSKTRTYLAKTLVSQIESVKNYGDIDSYTEDVVEGKGRSH